VSYCVVFYNVFNIPTTPPLPVPLINPKSKTQDHTHHPNTVPIL
jgi:hypothetical protein